MEDKILQAYFTAAERRHDRLKAAFEEFAEGISDDLINLSLEMEALKADLQDLRAAGVTLGDTLQASQEALGEATVDPSAILASLKP
ncbi:MULTISPECIES: hypothetical protein [Deinococcus]|uniref:Uncharacterized protein n=1 Tax=Deinococcus rufus TaxID=2136097 RepID=A0ABV7Z7V8_9DEIO|nr:hypothetical protein [Deinococcus sp. AB2017081]WQE94410.1 hypothetical protein U2P90_13475 [Deinococcus sp. AB2017081]